LLARSNAVTDFFEFLLTDAGPPDKPQTVNSMLARSDSLLSNEFAANPEQQAAILQAQASYYVTVGNPGLAEPKLRRALALLRGSSDNVLRAEVSCLHGFAVSMQGDVDAGAKEIEAALHDRELTPFAAANCHQQMAFIAENKGDGPNTQKSAEAGLALLRSSQRPAPRLEASLLGDLAYAEQLQGRTDSADRLYGEAMAKLTAMGRDRTPLAISIENNWAIASLGAGDPKRALALYEQAARTLRERDPESPLPSYLSGNLAHALELTGHPERALAMYQQAAADARRDGRLDIRLFGLLGAASAYCELGALDRAAEALADARATMRGAVPAGSPPVLTADAVAARIALARGDLDEANRLFSATLAAFQARDQSGGSVVMLHLGRSDAALRQGRSDDALRDARAGLAMAQRLQGGIAHSNRTGLAWLAIANALAAQGRMDEARAALTSALDQLEQALGDEHPATRRALALQGEIAPR
jgi:tetratricopeptide (TPR) repeat protein